MSVRQCARTMKHTVLIAALLAAATSASLAAAEKRQFEVAAGSAVRSLNEFSRQANIQLLFDSDAVRGFHTRAVSGELEVADALAQLLGGTSLVFDFVNERTVVVMLQGAAPAKSQRTSSAGRTNKYTRLAQVDDGSAQLSSSAAAAVTSESLERQRIELEEIIVTGTNIRGVYPSSSPVQIYTAEDIARTGATTTEQFIAKLPQNFGTRTEFASTATGVTRNYEAVNTVDLRGLGVGTTLTLLNGRRLALANSGQTADVSMIPVGAIERVEVLSDGASAIYGADAVGGVINFILRDDFDGIETRVTYGGVTQGDLRQGSLTQTFGGAWSSGNGLVSLDYSSASALAAADRSYAATSVWGPGNLTPDAERYSALATISQDVGERFNIDGAFAFSQRDVEMVAYTSSVFLTNRPLLSDTAQYFANLGADYRITDSLNASLVATYAKVDVDTTWSAFGTTPAQGYDTDHHLLDVTATLDGALFALPAGSVRFVLGADSLSEQYQGERSANTTNLSGRDLGRRTTSAFGELFVPLIADTWNMPFVRRLELSLAARYTSYDDDSDPPVDRDFGEEVSPKVGVLWSPFESLNVRATYGESFRAPSLSQIDPTAAEVRLQGPVPVAGVSSAGLFLGGPSPRIDAETAETVTVGFDFRPRSLSGVRLSGTYFKIDYSDRIAAVALGPAAANPMAWPEVIWRPSSAAEIEELLRSAPITVNTTGIDITDPGAASQALFALPNLWVLEGRTRNLSLSEVDGFDLDITSQFRTAWGGLTLGAQVVKILSYLEQASPSSPVITVVDTVLRPADLRGRAYFGLNRGGLDTALNVQYVDDYHNPLVPAAAGGPHDVKSWTTLDWVTSYDFDRDGRQHGILGGVRLSLSVINLLDEDPPFVNRTTGGNPALSFSPGFDPANANPLGRVVNLGIVKKW